MGHYFLDTQYIGIHFERCFINSCKSLIFINYKTLSFVFDTIYTVLTLHVASCIKELLSYNDFFFFFRLYVFLFAYWVG